MTTPQGRCLWNRYPNFILSPPWEVLPVLPISLTQLEARGQGHPFSTLFFNYSSCSIQGHPLMCMVHTNHHPEAEQKRKGAEWIWEGSIRFPAQIVIKVEFNSKSLTEEKWGWIFWKVKISKIQNQECLCTNRWITKIYKVKKYQQCKNNLIKLWLWSDIA